MMTEYVLRELIETSLDGEWGKGEGGADLVPMLCIRGTDFAEARAGRLTGVPLRYIEARKARRKRLAPWDILIEVAGGTKDQITGRTLLLRPALFKLGETEITCASFSRFVRVRRDVCDPQFVFWYLQYLYVSGAMHAYHTQHTGVARFQWTTFADREPLWLPPLAQQRRIAAVLSAYDELIENCERRIRVLDEMARALYREWFVLFRYPGHEKVPLVDSPLGRIPKGWRVETLGKVARINAESIDLKNSPTRIRYIDISSVSPGSVDDVREYEFADAPGRARRVVRHGDVLWSCVRPNRRSHALVLHPDEGTIASTGFAVITPNLVPFSYLYAATTTDEFVGYLEKRATGAAYPAVTAKVFEDAPVLIPESSLLERFAADPGQEAMAMLRRRIVNLRETRDLLLPRLLSGQLSVEVSA
jgi:type I restriction enzyme S subunit